MKIEIGLKHKEYQLKLKGIRSLPQGYMITVEKSDGLGLTKLEAITALQTFINGLEDSTQSRKVFCG